MISSKPLKIIRNASIAAAAVLIFCRLVFGWADFVLGAAVVLTGVSQFITWFISEKLNGKRNSSTLFTAIFLIVLGITGIILVV